MNKIIYKDIDHYISTCPSKQQEKLNQLRILIKSIIPEATEKISWNMPTFYLEGNLIHFFLHKNHIGLYPGAEAVEYFKNKLKEYKTSKGAIQLPLDKSLPIELITRIVIFNVNKTNYKK